MKGSSGFAPPDADAIRQDLELMVTGRDRGPRLLIWLPELLQVRVPEDPLLVGKPVDAVIPFLHRAIDRAGAGDAVRAEAMRILLGLAAGSSTKFKTQRCNEIGDLYARHRRSPRSGKVVAVNEAARLLDLVTDAIVAMENEAMDWREERDVTESVSPHNAAPPMEWKEFELGTQQLAEELDRREVETVVAIARRGVTLGLQLADQLGVRSFGTVTTWKCPTDPPRKGRHRVPGPRFEAIGLPEGSPKVVAIVDNMVGRGRTMAAAKQLVRAHYSPHEPDVVFGALYQIPRDTPLPQDVQKSLVLGVGEWTADRRWLPPWESPDNGEPEHRRSVHMARSRTN
jgi:adenine/guanine phosphoribosyltransferase-like PRPP-binding protein